jgi:hypothetical protein
MHIRKTKKLIKASLYAAIIACAAGAATGTYAWYSYQKDVNVDLVGTTIKADKEIQVGLRSDSVIPEMLEEFRLGEVELETGVKYNEHDTDSFNVYWIRGNYLTDILSFFHEKINSAQGVLRAITAGEYATGSAEDIGNLNPAANHWNGFKKQPTQTETEWKHSGLVGSDKKDFFYLPLVFRAISNEKDANGDPIYLPNVEVFLSEFTSEDKDVEAGSSLDLSSALRCKVDYPSHADTSDNFIFDPNASSSDRLPVGGVLNIGFDPFYDYDHFTNKEIPYGEWDGPVVYEANPVAADGILTIDECSTFYANHKKDVYRIDLNQSHPCVCETLARSAAVNPSLQAGNGLTRTNTYNHYGYVDLSIYLEGWDENIVNSRSREGSTDGHRFSIELQFSIN